MSKKNIGSLQYCGNPSIVVNAVVIIKLSNDNHFVGGTPACYIMLGITRPIPYPSHYNEKLTHHHLGG